MKNYLKHLKENPSKIAWLIIVWLIIIGLMIVLLLNKDLIIEDIGGIVYCSLWSFVSIILLLANYQPYKEYKDGL